MDHTPGPWAIYKCRCGDPICNQYTISVQGSVGFSKADAQLIAAAPDLLRALEAARVFIVDQFANPAVSENGQWLDQDARPVHDQICAAINRTSI